MIVHEDYTHHTSEDTPDKVDPVELERSEILATGAALYLASLTPQEGIDLAHLAGANGARRLAEASRVLQRQIVAADNAEVAAAWAETLNALDHIKNVELETLSSILIFSNDPAVVEAVDILREQLVNEHESLLRLVRSVAHARGARGERPEPLSGPDDDRVPVRLTRGPLDFGLPASRLKGDDRDWYSSPQFTLSGDERFELVNFIDGNRTISAIRNSLSAEFGQIETAVVARYIEDLVKVGALAWK
jgi:hypothetical protein